MANGSTPHKSGDTGRVASDVTAVLMRSEIARRIRFAVQNKLVDGDYVPGVGNVDAATRSRANDTCTDSDDEDPPSDYGG